MRRIITIAAMLAMLAIPAAAGATTILANGGSYFSASGPATS